MNKKISNWIAIPIILIAFSVLIGMSVKIGFDKGVEAEHWAAYNLGIQTQHPISYRQGYDRGYQEAWKVGYDKGYADGQAPYKSSINTTISLERALSILELGRQNHLAWATNPDLVAQQTKETGNSDFNLMWAGYYADLEEFAKYYYATAEIVLKGD